MAINYEKILEKLLAAVERLPDEQRDAFNYYTTHAPEQRCISARTHGGGASRLYQAARRGAEGGRNEGKIPPVRLRRRPSRR